MGDGEEGFAEGHVTIETAIGRMDQQTLELFYRVTNGLEHKILLLTPLPRAEAETTRGDSARVYAYVDPDGILQLTKRIWPVPEDLDPLFLEVPFATEVGPGQMFEERIVMGLPIQVEYPYGLDLEEQEGKPEDVVGVAGGVAFSIGYLVEDKGPLRAGAVSGESGAKFWVRYGTASEHQRILQGETLGIGVPVRETRH